MSQTSATDSYVTADGRTIGSAVMEMQNITLRFGGVTAIEDISFDIREGEIRAIIGPNGAGKSSMLNVINGFYHPQEGKVLYKGAERKPLKPYEIAHQGIARTFQNIALFKTYVAFLRKSYGTNYALIAALLTAFQRTSSRQITDIEELRRFFTERLKDDEKFKIKNEGIPAYRMFVLICRRVLSAPNRQLALMLPEAAGPSPPIVVPAGAEGSELSDGLLISGQQAVPVRANPSTSILRPDGGV